MNIVSSIWTRPRAALRQVLDTPSFLIPFIILYFGSVGASLLALYDSQGMDMATEFQMEPIDIPLWVTLIGVVVIAPIFYFISTVIYAFFTMLFGKWLFKGVATFKELLKIISIAYLPFILVIPIIGVWLIINSDSFLEAQNTGIVGLLAIILLSIFCSIYTFIINLVGISEVHQFSKWKAFFTMIIPAIIFGIIVFIIIVVLVLLAFLLFAGLAGM